MIIDKVKIKKLIIKNPNCQVVGELTDDKAEMRPGYKVEAIPDYENQPVYIAMQGDVLYYTDKPEEKYMVTQADDKFFTMVPVVPDWKNNSISYVSEHSRTYPNNSDYGSFEKYGISIEYRGADHVGSDKEKA